MDRTASPHAFADLEHAIGSVSGVAHARIHVLEETGKARLRIRLAPGQDPDQVSRAVAATLRERFGIDLDPGQIRRQATQETVAEPASVPRSARPDQPPLEVAAPEAASPEDADALPGGEVAPGGEAVPAAQEAPHLAEDAMATVVSGAIVSVTGDPTVIDPTVIDPTVIDPAVVAPGAADPTAADPAEQTGLPSPLLSSQAGIDVDRGARIVIRNLDVQQHDGQAAVCVVLALHGREAAAEVTADTSEGGRLRAAAEATIEALRTLSGGLLQAGIEQVSVQSDPSSITVLTTMLVDGDLQQLLGAALVRSDTELAVTRATLDALNRRVAPWVVQIGPDLPADAGASGVDVS